MDRQQAEEATTYATFTPVQFVFDKIYVAAKFAPHNPHWKGPHKAFAVSAKDAINNPQFEIQVERSVPVNLIREAGVY